MSNSSRRGSADVGGRRGGTAARAVVLAALVVLSTVVSGGTVVATDQGTPVASNQPGTPGELLVDGDRSTVDGEPATGNSTGNRTPVENETATATASAAENDTTTANDTATTRIPDEGAAGEVTTATPVITGCTTITSPGVYEVESFATASSGFRCLVVDASDVTLRGTGAGSTLTGPGSGTAIDVGIGTSTPTNVTVRGLAADGWGRGIELRQVSDVTVADVAIRDASTVGIGMGFTSDVTLRDVAVTDGRGPAIAASFASDVVVENLTVESYATGNAGGGTTPGTAISAYSTSLTARNVTVRDADVGVSVTGVFFTSSGAVVGLTTRDVPTAVSIGGAHADLQFVDVDTGTATVSFTGANVTLGPATTAPSPPTPAGLRNATGHLHLTPTGSGAASVVVDYGQRVAEVHEPSVRTRRYDGGAWVQEGTIDPATDSVTFAPTRPGVYGVFYERTPVDRCGTLDAPGVYEVASFAGPPSRTTCLVVGASDVTLRGTEPGSTITGSGSGLAIGTDPSAFYSNVTVRNLVVDGWPSGIGLAGVLDVAVADVTVRNGSGIGVLLVDTVDATVRDVAVTDGRGTALAVLFGSNVTVEGLSVESYGPGITTLGASPGTAIVVARTTLAVRDVTVRDAARGFEAREGGAVDGVEGRVVDLTTRDVPESVSLPDDYPELQFVGVDTGTATVSFTGANVVLGPATTTPSPPTPTGLRNATGYLNLTPTGTGAASVVVDYGDAVAEVYESSVQAERYDPGGGSWVQDGTVNRSADTVTFAPTGPGVVGVFYSRVPLGDCGVVDVPGVYEVASFDGPVDVGVCLSIAADDVTLRGTPGATVTGNGSGIGVAVDGTSLNRYENVTVRDVGVERYRVGVGATDVASVLVDDVRVADAELGVAVTRTGDATVRGTTAVDTSGAGVYVLATDRATIRDVTVQRPEAIGVGVGSVSRLTVDGLTVEDAADGTRFGDRTSTPGTGLLLDGIGELDGRDVVVRNASRGVLLLDPTPGTIATVSTTDVDEAINATGDHSRTVVRSLLTASGEVTVVGPDRVTVAPASVAGTPAGRPVRIAGVDVAGLAAGAETTLVFPFDAATVDAENVSVYRFDAGAADWIAVDGRVDAAGGTIAARVAPPAGTTVTYAAFAPSAETVPAPTACPRSAEFGGSGTAAGTNVDADPACEDVDGSGRLDFLDVIDALFLDFGRANGDPAARTAYDFDASGRVDFLDVVTLLFELS